MSYVREVSKNNRLVRWSRFSYDERHELKSASDWRGRSIVITPDPAARRISEVTNEAGLKAHFIYDEKGKMAWAEVTRQEHMVRVPMVPTNQGRPKPDVPPELKGAAQDLGALLSELTGMIKLAGVKLSFEE